MRFLDPKMKLVLSVVGGCASASLFFTWVVNVHISALRPKSLLEIQEFVEL